MNIKKFFVLICVIIFVSAFKVDRVYSKYNLKNNTKNVYVVDNKKDFCSMLPYCVNKNIPLIISNGNSEMIYDFCEKYNGNIVKIGSKDIISFLKNEFNSDTLVISAEDSNEMKILASQIACKLKCPIIYKSDVNEFFYNNHKKFKKVIEIGNVNYNYDNNIVQYKYIDDVERLYDKVVPNNDLNIYMMNQFENDVLGLYLAAYRGGKIYFDVNKISNINKYFAWVIDPQDFSPSKYLELNSYIQRKSNGKYSKGIGVITGNNIEDTNLLLVRSFFYKDLKKSSNVVDTEQMDNNVNKLLDEMKKSIYIRIFAHGSYNEIQLKNNYKLNNNNFPKLLNTPLISTESCETCEKLDGGIALSAIHNGAVAYIGSIKMGGTESWFIQKPYLVSTHEVPLSNIVLANNLEIKKYTDNSIRAVLIGDPLWGMYNNVGKWEQNKKYKYNIPNMNITKYTIPIKVNDNLSVNGIITDKGDVSINRIVKIGDSKIIFLSCKKNIGTMQFSSKMFFKQYLVKLLNDFINGEDFFINNFVSNDIIIIIQILICTITLFYLFKRKEQIKVNKILVFVTACVMCLFQYAAMKLSISWILAIYYVLLYLIIYILSSFKARTFFMCMITIMPVWAVLLLLNSNKYILLYSLIGAIATTFNQLILYTAINIFFDFTKKFKILAHTQINEKE